MTDAQEEYRKTHVAIARVKALFSRGNSVNDQPTLLPDHTQTLLPEFSDTAASFGEDGSGHYSGRNLPHLLRESARETLGNVQKLREAASAVDQSRGSLRSLDTTETAGYLRLFVAVGWIFVGGLYYQAHITARATDNDAVVTASGMPISDAMQISTVFLTLGTAAGLAAIALILANAVMTMRNKDALIKNSQEFGLNIAKMMEMYGKRLNDHRRELDSDKRRDESVLFEVSQAHISAQAAMTMFETLPFLRHISERSNAEEIENAIIAYHNFLRSSRSHANAGTVWIEGILMGGSFGILIGIMLGLQFAFKLAGIDTASALSSLNLGLINGFEQYPILLALILGGALLYIFLGIPSDSIAAMTRGKDRRDRVRESMDTALGQITQTGAPNAQQISERVEDLSAIFRVRLMGRQAAPGIAATAPGGRKLADAETDEIPPWRRPKEGPRFVDPTFDAAPKQWRTDAYAQFLAKKSNPSPDAKRSLLGFKKPPQD